MELSNNMNFSKTLIALNGPSQSGKTLSLKLLLQFIRKETESPIYKSKKWKECLEVHTLEDLKVGITSRSDKAQKLKENLDFLIKDMNCNVVITAINLKAKGSEEILAELESKNWEIELIEKYPLYCNRAQKSLHLDLNLQAAKALWTRLHQVGKNLENDNIQTETLKL